MIIKQLSVFLENKSGRLSEVTNILGDAGINMTAFSIADTSDFGILRVIVSDPEKALRLLKENHFSVNLTDVVCLSSPNQPGAMAKALKILSDEEISIEYMYAFSIGDTANIVIRPTNVRKCIDVLQEHELELLKSSDLYKI
jgi:hypothetical protein